MIKKVGTYTRRFEKPPEILGYASVAGKKEWEGPLQASFDKVIYDAHAGMDSWEKAESLFQQEALSIAIQKSKCNAEDINLIFAGDLLNQCISSAYGLRDFNIPYLGQYGACSTMAQSLLLASLTVAAQWAEIAACVTSSHFCSAERQYRFPLEYGGQRPPTSQWTVTGSGSCILGYGEGQKPKVRAGTFGRIIDLGVTDINNMGAAMAPAAVMTLKNFLEDTKTSPDNYDKIYTGDLGSTGSDLFCQLLAKEGIFLSNHEDCGLMIFDINKSDVHSGGSGCGCSASVLCGRILNEVQAGNQKNILFIATGALMSPISIQQGESIPSIAHLINIVN